MPRTVVLAPDSFKGSLSAADAAAALAEGWALVAPGDRLELLPQADGGEGTLEAIAAAVPAARRHAVPSVTGPDGRPVPAEWLELPGRHAVVELAVSSGLPLMRALDPLGATTRGLGEVLRAALRGGADRCTVALGGSASTDGGSGALAALGLVLTDAAGDRLPDGGGALARLARLDASDLVAPPPGGVRLLADVTAPLLGPTGAAAVFGPQKGAAPAQVDALDAALARFTALLGGDPAAAGAGAAGGTAFGLAAAWGAVIESGADHVARLTGLPAALERADVVVTGEGRFDAQSTGGKVVGGVLRLAAGRGIPAAVVAGRIDAATSAWTCSLTGLAGGEAAAMADPARWLRAAGAAAAGAFG